MSDPKPYQIPDEADYDPQSELDKMISDYQTEIVRLRNKVERLKLDLTDAIKYQKKYLILSMKTGYEVCPICDNGLVKGVNSEEVPNGLSIHLYSACATCGGEGVLKTNKQ